MDERTGLSKPARASPDQWRESEQPVGCRQPEWAAWLDRHVEILARREVFVFDQFRRVPFGVVERADGRGPPRSIRAAPRVPNFLAARALGDPALAIKIDQDLLMVSRKLRHGSNSAGLILMQLLQVLNLQARRNQMLLPLSVWLQVAERSRDFSQAARARDP